MTNDPVTLAYTQWTLVELDGKPVEIAADQLAPSLVLDLEEARVTGSGGVNRLTGQFALSGDELRFGPLATTRMAGPEVRCSARVPSSPRSSGSPRTCSTAGRSRSSPMTTPS